MFEQMGLWAASVLVTVIATRLLPGWWRKGSAAVRKDIKAKAAIYLTDPEWKAIITQIVLKVQKDAGSAANVDKLRMATAWAKKSIPTNLDDIIIDAMVELILEEIKKPIEL